MSKTNRPNDSEKVVHEALHLTRSDGTLSRNFNARNGKWETETNSGGNEELAFDPKTGKLVVKRRDADSALAIPMAAAGFFIKCSFEHNMD